MQPGGRVIQKYLPLIPLDPAFKVSAPPPPSLYFMCPMLTGTLCTETRCPTDRLPGTPCCPAVCVSGSLLHVVPLPRIGSHGPAARPVIILQSPGGKLVSDQQVKHSFLSIGVRLVTLHRCAGSSRRAAGRPVSIDFRSVMSTCLGRVPLGWFTQRLTRRGVAVHPDPAGRAQSNSRAGV